MGFCKDLFRGDRATEHTGGPLQPHAKSLSAVQPQAGEGSEKSHRDPGEGTGHPCHAPCRPDRRASSGSYKYPQSNTTVIFAPLSQVGDAAGDTVGHPTPCRPGGAAGAGGFPPVGADLGWARGRLAARLRCSR